MRALIQRVSHGSVTVDGSIVGRIEQGFVVLLGVTHDDTSAQAQQLATKTVNLRIFDDGQGKMNLSLLDVGGGVLVVPQFTLYANLKGARRPDFFAAARPETAEPLFEQYVAYIRALGVARVETSIFRAVMHVEIHNDGPVTIWLDTATL
ncbi:MAG: D-aminoacyl-tRNA deacylase [Aggregatilineales bacterium]